MSWVGGKKALRDAIVARLDERCDRYVEVFGGGGWVQNISSAFGVTFTDADKERLKQLYGGYT